MRRCRDRSARCRRIKRAAALLTTCGGRGAEQRNIHRAAPAKTRASGGGKGEVRAAHEKLRQLRPSTMQVALALACPRPRPARVPSPPRPFFSSSLTRHVCAQSSAHCRMSEPPIILDVGSTASLSEGPDIVTLIALAAFVGTVAFCSCQAFLAPRRTFCAMKMAED